MYIFILIYLFSFVYIGFAQPNRCTTRSYEYNIQNRFISSNSNITNPILYNGPNYCCIDDDHFTTCEALRTNPMFQQPADPFSSFFSLPDKDYFPQLSSIMFMCLISIYIISGNNLQMDRVTERKIAYFSEFLGILIIITVFYSAYHSQIMYTESCANTLIRPNNNPSTTTGSGGGGGAGGGTGSSTGTGTGIGSNTMAPDIPNFCHILYQCELTLVSVLDVEGTVADDYKRTMYIIGKL